MFVGIDLGSWTEPLFLVSSILTIAAGVLGFAQEHRTPEGKLTGAGKALAVILVVAGVTALALGLADRKIADEKDRLEDSERDEQFRSQMKELGRVTERLGGVSGSLSDLQSDMGESLLTQRGLFDKADANLRMSGALQRQSRAETLNVLRRVFEESNRLTPERVAVVARIICDPTDHPYPTHPDIDRVRVSVTKGKSGSVELTSTRFSEISQGVVFHGFLGDLGAFETFSAWKDAKVTIRLDASSPSVGTPLERFAEVQTYEERQRELGRDPRAMTCFAAAALLLNGRQILQASGPFRQEHSAVFTADFEGMKVDPGRLPYFTN